MPNGLARWTSNPKVVGLTPTVGATEAMLYRRALIFS